MKLAETSFYKMDIDKEDNIVITLSNQSELARVLVDNMKKVGQDIVCDDLIDRLHTAYQYSIMAQNLRDKRKKRGETHV